MWWEGNEHRKGRWEEQEMSGGESKEIGVTDSDDDGKVMEN